MFKNALFGGINAAVITAMRADMSIDIMETVRHSKWLLENGCNGLAILGTTGEANSLSVSERMGLLEGLVSHSIPATTLLPGTSMPNVPDTIALTKHAANLGCRGVLLLPPFYYKNPSEDGLAEFYDEVIQGVGGDVKIYFYNFPQQSAVPITVSLVERLLKKYPRKIKGIKDSSGNFANTKSYIDNFTASGFEVYTGDDAGLLRVLEAGGAGCITATSNLVSPIAARIWANFGSVNAAEAQAIVAKIRAAVALAPTIPAVKTLAAHLTGNSSWLNVRPPHTKLSDAAARALIAAFDVCKVSISPQKGAPIGVLSSR